MESYILNLETPTRTESNIDNIATNCTFTKTDNCNCKNIDEGLSDHNCLLIAVKKKFAKPQSNSYQKRIVDSDSMKHFLNNLNSSFYLLPATRCVNIMYTNILEWFLLNFSLSFPLKIFRTTHTIKHRWHTSGIKKSAEQK